MALVASGCLGGHLFDAARRRELPRVVTMAALDDDRLIVTYTASVTTDLGRPIGQVQRRAALRLSDLTRSDRPADAFSVERGGAVGGQALPVVRTNSAGSSPPLLRVLEAEDPIRTRLVLRTPEREYPAFPLAALTRTRYEPWVWAVLPFALAGDAVIVPVLVVLGPAVMLVGD